MDFEYNMDSDRRDEIFGGLLDSTNMGGIIHYTGLSASKLKTLIKERFADPDETQNDSPTIQEFLDFMTEYPGFRAHGYIVEKERSDYRVSIEGLEWEDEDEIPVQALIDFAEMFRFADEFCLEKFNAYCWFD